MQIGPYLAQKGQSGVFRGYEDMVPVLSLDILSGLSSAGVPRIRTYQGGADSRLAQTNRHTV